MKACPTSVGAVQKLHTATLLAKSYIPSEAAEITRPLKNHKAINALKAAVQFVQIQ